MDRKTILIADDAVINRTAISAVLGENYDVLEARNGQEALDLLLMFTDKISALLLDLMMPVMDGYEVLRSMAAYDLLEEVPVVVITTEDDSTTELKALELGATDFLTKPIEPRIARRRIKTVIEQRELEDLRLQSRLLSELQYRADHDELTGIYSKDAFYRMTREMLDSPESKGKSFYVFCWNINRFKLINDLFGWDEGNKLLCDAAHTLEESVEGLGTYGRIESDHFAICLPLSSPESLNEIVDKAQKWSDSLTVKQVISLSIGVYEVTDTALSINQMCDRATMALAAVKGTYAVEYAFYDDEMRRRLVEEQDIIDNMQAALDNGEFEAFFQPIYDVVTGRPASAESLVRWRRPDVGLVSPGVFIPLFERNGFISSLDRYMWEQVCKVLKDRQQSGYEPLPISVNVSRKSMYDPGLCDFIFGLTQKYEIDPHLLRIEVTESAYMDNPDQLIATVSHLQSHGFLVLMDDFGSGYSSFNTLKDIPVDILKIDMAFMEGFEEGGRTATILSSILRMSKWLDIPVIAEGVETIDQNDFLASIGCDYIQGFYYARPMCYEDFQQHVERKGVAAKAKEARLNTAILDSVMGGNAIIDKVMDGMFDGFAVFEYRTTAIELIRANASFMDLFDFNDGAFSHTIEDAWSILTPEDVEPTNRAIEKVCSTKKPAHLVIHHKNDDGTLLTVQTTISYLGGRDGNPLLFTVFYLV